MPLANGHRFAVGLPISPTSSAPARSTLVWVLGNGSCGVPRSALPCAH
ncbi:MAG TPA: hypothetical protein VGN81_28930 [Pseudonocardiaceae bacterium]